MKEKKRDTGREGKRESSYNVIAECSLCRSSTSDEGGKGGMKRKGLAKGPGPFRRITGLGI